ncbi:ATPase [Aeromonas caviae]|uniref:VapE domain-containing protein n=1 Tax=Aeromonas caviae TaxID=648 RepID=UPI00191CAC27|nr:VapE domain-containing protein [Aeromonas caviae]MBL0547705.1 ATPase [Aeromonas caviae]
MSTPKPSNVVKFEQPETTASQLPALRDLTNDGRPLKTSANLAAILSFYKWQARYNMMTAEPELRAAGKRLGGSEEGQRSRLVDACQRSGVPDSAIDEHLIALCQHNSFHPVKEWLENGPEWDGAKRLAGAIRSLNAADPQYAAAVLRPWFVGCIAALYEPRFVSKLVPVLVGGQSSRKSAWINRLAAVVPDSTLDCAINPERTDDVRRAVSAWIVELAELESTTKHEAGALKAFLTRDVDRFRLPYAKAMTTKPRQTAFIASVNGSDFLKDQTGNARFAVIELAGAAKIDRLNELLGWDWDAGRLRQVDGEALRQFWLEIKHAYDAGESWYLDENAAEQAAKANDAATDKGAQYEAIFDYHLARKMSAHRWFTAGELCAWHGEKPSACRAWGKALTLLAAEGRIEAKELRGRRKEYRLPVNSAESVSKDSDS